jgi:sensor domain CHASE-containing protein
VSVPLRTALQIKEAPVAASAHLLLSALSKRPAEPTAEPVRVFSTENAGPVRRSSAANTEPIRVFSAESTCSQAPLTSEPPLPDAEPLTSEPPLAAPDPHSTRP